MREGRIAERGGFDLLYDDALRGRCGLRAARVDDPRRTLPDCAEELLEPGEGGLAVSGLRFAYSGKPALFDGVDVSIPAGVTALIGDNGTGKTTLARLLTGLNARAGRAVRPSRGSRSRHRNCFPEWALCSRTPITSSI